MDDLARTLASLLRKVTACREDSAVAFSGGLDSGILAYLLKDCKPALYTVGIEDSKDMENAKRAAQLLNLPLQPIEINEYDVIEGIIFLKRVDPEISAVEISFELPLYFVCSRAEEKNIFTGQGSDELFGGYHKYLEKPEIMREDFEKLMSKTKPRELKIASLLGKELFTPYLHERVINFSKNIPVESKIKEGTRKWILREAGRILGVPEEIISREKKAAQYGSGIWKVLKSMAKREGKDVESFVNSL